MGDDSRAPAPRTWTRRSGPHVARSSHGGARPPVTRAKLLRRLAELIADNAERIAVVETTDNGKLIREMEGQLRGLADYYHYYAGAADKVGGETLPADRDNFFVYTLREPLGVVAAITPWNSPVLLMSWKAAPALAAGCTLVVKPAEQAPASTLEFAALVEEAGFPPGVFNVVTGFGDEAGAPLVAHPGVDKVAFTGGTATGKAVMKGAAEHLARVTLELGGKSPNIVFEDADLEAAANGVVAGIFAATGQTCMAGSRLFVQDSVHDEFVERLAARAREIRLGDPLDPATEMGPVAFEGHLEKVAGRDRVGAGGGRARWSPAAAGPTRPGFFVEPTIFGDVTNGMDIARNEIFGPVLAALRFADEEEAIALANATRVRAGRGRLDARRAARAPDGARAARRHRLGQRLPRRRPDGAVRRLQGLRHGPRERPPGGRRVHRAQDGLDRAHRRDARPVPAGLRFSSRLARIDRLAGA